MISRLYKKFNKDGSAFELLPPSPDLSEIEGFTKITLPEYEKTEFGYQILPDTANGAGPIYFSIIKKNNTLL